MENFEAPDVLSPSFQILFSPSISLTHPQNRNTDPLDGKYLAMS